ncbi:Polyphosphate:AMP phosphotransferase [Eubacterium plexicaudatum ASF492]|nr:Polyphosphate:AMP phosphotransferase [Eubacterium plexicaudatum ASF492]
MEEPTLEESRKPFLYRHFVKIPEAGKFQFLDSGWMDEIVEAKLHQHLSGEDYKNRIDSIKRFERQLTDNGYLVMKFFYIYPEKNKKIELITC